MQRIRFTLLHGLYIVRSETTESWEWFLKKLREDLAIGLGDGFTFISDKQKGLKNALASVLPNAEHMNCTKHVYGNWKKKFGDEDYKPYFWNVAYNKTMAEYISNMAELMEYDSEAHAALLAQEPEAWCLAFQSTNPKSINVCNGLSESFNRTIKGARELPLINMLEAVRRQAMTCIARRYNIATKCILPFPKKVVAILEKTEKRVRMLLC